MTAEYWQRRNEEMKHIQDMFDSDAAYNAEIKRIYDRAQREIQKEIDAFITNYAKGENISIADALKQVNKMDVEAFAEKAKQYVKERDFSPQANEELKKYNLRMKMSRLEMLNHHIQLETIAMANDEEKLLTARLDEEVYNEYVRQAGILGESVPSVAQLKSISKVIVTADFHGANFSSRIWVNRAELQNELEKAISRTMIQGENPRVTARNLRRLVNDNVKNKRYVAERLAITESSRVQGQTARQSFEDYGYEEYMWIAEPGACKICKPLDGKVFKVKDMGGSSPAIPQHPSCRCSTAAHMDRAKLEKRLAEIEGKGSKKKATSEDKRSDSDIIKLGELESKYASKHVDKIKEMLSDSPEKIKRVWNDVADNFKVLDSKKKGAFFNAGNAAGEGRGVKLNIASVAKGNDYQKPYQVAFHEYGHHIDYELNKKYGNKLYDQAFSQVYKDGLLDKTIKKEGKKVISEYADKNYDRIATEKLPGVWNKRYNNLKGKYSGWEDIESKLNDRDFVGPERLMLDMIRNQVHGEWQTTMKDSLEPSQRSDISDMFEAVSVNSYPLGYGHGKVYHNKNGTAKEAFAEMYSATISNPESLEQIKKYFPDSYKVFEEIIGVVE